MFCVITSLSINLPHGVVATRVLQMTPVSMTDQCSIQAVAVIVSPNHSANTERAD